MEHKERSTFGAWMESEQKPHHCPLCGFTPVATVLHTNPIHSTEHQQKLASGEITFGGDIMMEKHIDAPNWQCSQCGIYIYQKKVRAIEDLHELSNAELKELVEIRYQVRLESIHSHDAIVLLNALSKSGDEARQIQKSIWTRLISKLNQYERRLSHVPAHCA